VGVLRFRAPLPITLSIVIMLRCFCNPKLAEMSAEIKAFIVFIDFRGVQSASA
jgi:hypothetical protein